MITTKSFQALSLITLGLALLLGAPDFTRAQNQVMGELKLSGPTKIEKSSGVWIDGQYVGYLKELKGVLSTKPSSFPHTSDQTSALVQALFQDT